MRRPPRWPRRTQSPATCAARGRRGCPGRWTGRPCARRPRRAPRARWVRSSRCGHAAGGTAHRGRGDHPDRDVVVGDDLVELIERGGPRRRRRPPRGGAGGRRRAGRPPGTRGCGTRSSWPGVAEVADADADDRPVLGDADLAGDLVAQVVDVVPDAARAQRPRWLRSLRSFAPSTGGCGEQRLEHVARLLGAPAPARGGRRQSGHRGLGMSRGRTSRGKSVQSLLSSPWHESVPAGSGPETGGAARPAATRSCERETEAPVRTPTGRASACRRPPRRGSATPAAVDRARWAAGSIVDAPEVVLPAVDEGHGDLVVEALDEGGEPPSITSAYSPRSPQTRATTSRAASAQVAARAVRTSPRLHGLILTVHGVVDRALVQPPQPALLHLPGAGERQPSTTSTRLGRVKRASRSAQWDRTALATALRTLPGRGAPAPVSSSAAPSTATSTRPAPRGPRPPPRPDNR